MWRCHNRKDGDAVASFNKVILMGNLTRDPELKYTQSQTAVCNFSMAVNRKFKGGDGQMKDEAVFVDCTAWGKKAENIQEYVHKGQPLFIEGRLTLNSWEKDGQKHSKLLVTVETFQLMGDRGKPQAAAAPAAEADTQEPPIPFDLSLSA
jgi:single-strand DNA-binding protein